MKIYEKPLIKLENIELIDVVMASGTFGSYNGNDTLIDFGEL